MGPMRDKGSGTITWRQDRKRWQVAVTFETGRVYRYVKGPPPPAKRTKAVERYAPAEAREVLAELLKLREAEIDVPASRLTVAAWLRQWIGSLERGNRVRPSTLRYYRMIAELHIIDGLGDVPLAKLTPRRVQAWVDGMTGSPRSIAHRRDVLRASLNVAMRRGIVVRNVAMMVDLPEPDSTEAPTLTPEQAMALLSGTADTWYGPLWAFLLGTGVRISEALGVIWEDVDLDAGTVIIDRQLEQVGTEIVGGRKVAVWARGPVKAARSAKAMTLPPFAAEALDRHKRRMGRERKPDWTHFGHVFVTSKGRPPQETFIVKLLARELKRLKLPTITTHGLRHTNATLMRAEGIDEQTRMKRLGHNTTKMARHYAHVVDADDRAAADALQRAIGGAG